MGHETNLATVESKLIKFARSVYLIKYETYCLQGLLDWMLLCGF